jgi:metal-dependent amidase/aminoacylase/carboxypeptidase family protein
MTLNNICFIDVYEELNFEEHHAHKILTDYLEKKGFTVERKYVVDTAFKAELGSSDFGPNIAVICEYDALINGHSSFVVHII